MSPASRRVRVRLSAGSALAGLLLLVTAPGAVAHDELIGSDPVPGSALDVAPTAVRLDFSDDVLTFGAAIIVADAADDTWQSGDPVLDGSSVSVPLQPLPDGAYEVRWRVVSSDGHPITGLVPFTVGDVATGSTDAGTPPGAPGTDDDRPTDEPSATALVPGGEGGGTPAWRTPVVAGGGAVLAVGVYALVLALRSRRSSGTSR